MHLSQWVLIMFRHHGGAYLVLARGTSVKRSYAMADKKAPPSKCWPDDPDALDGFTELFLPSETYLKAYWDCDILDDDKNPLDKIIESNEAFQVRFRVELRGRLRKCICGHWCFDVC